MSNMDIFDELENRTEEAGLDYADWWEPDTDGDELIGVVVEMHSEPEQWTDAGQVPGTIYTVLSVGKGDVEAGTAVTPRQHKQLISAFAGVELGDFVRVLFTGYEKVKGQTTPMNTYEVGIIPGDEWVELDGADEIEEIVEEYDGPTGDNRRTEPYTMATQVTGAGRDGTMMIDEQSSELAQASQALRELVGINEGSVDVETAERIINEVRGYDVTVEEAAIAAGLDIGAGIISS